jgi:signal peptidase I
MKILNTLILSALMLCGISFMSGYRICYNESHSLPQKLFFARPIKSLDRGQIITFSTPKSSVTFAKIIAGVPGDTIKVENHKLYINGLEKATILEPLKPILDGIIPNDFYLMLGVSSDSFDSRYDEFGLIPRNAMKEQLWPIL